MASFCAACAKPLSSKDTRCPSCGADTTDGLGAAVFSGQLTGHPTPTIPPTVSSPAATKVSVPGRVATGTVAGFGPVRQEPVVGPLTPNLVRLGALLTGLGLLATLAVGGVSLFGKGVLVAASCLVVLLALGTVLHAALPEHVRKVPKNNSLVFTLLVQMLALPMRAKSRARTVDVRSMSIKEVSGVTVVCDICGSLRGGAPAQGDMVEVYGRHRPTGTVLVRSLVDLTSKTTASVRMPPACVVTRLASTATVGIWAIAILGLAWLLISGD